MEDCVFCKIINGEIPSEKVYEDEGDMMKEVNLFEQTNSKLDHWKSV